MKHLLGSIYILTLSVLARWFRLPGKYFFKHLAGILRYCFDKRPETAFYITRLVEYPVCISLLKPCAGETILDLGTGDSMLPDYLRHFGACVVETDLKAPMSEHKSSVYSIRANVVSLPYRDNAFDKVVCISMLNELEKSNDILAMKEILRIVKPGGVVFLSFELDSHESHENQGGRKIRRYSRGSARDRLLSFPQVKLLESGIFCKNLWIRKIFERHRLGARFDFFIPFIIPFFVIFKIKGFLKWEPIRRGSFGYFFIQKRKG